MRIELNNLTVKFIKSNLKTEEILNTEELAEKISKLLARTIWGKDNDTSTNKRTKTRN